MAKYGPIIRNVFDDPSEVKHEHVKQITYPKYYAYIYKNHYEDSPVMSVVSTDTDDMHKMIKFIVEKYHYIYDNRFTCEFLQFKPENETYVINQLTGEMMYTINDIPEKYHQPEYMELVDRR